MSPSRSLVAIRQPVADAPHVDDPPPARWRKLAAQTACVRVERPRRPHELESPYVAQKLFLREHTRGLGRQGAKQRELLRRQIDLPVAQPHLARDRVDPQLAHLKHALSPPLTRAPE